MESDLQKKRKSAEDSALFDNVASEKLKFPLYIFSDTMETTVVPKRSLWKRQFGFTVVIF